MKNLTDIILNNAFEAIIYYLPVKNTEGEIIDFTFEYMNNSAFKILSGGRADYIGNNFLRVFPFAAEEGLFQLFKTTAATGEPGEKVFYFEHGENKGWYRNSVCKYQDGIIVYFRDVTEQKMLEGALEQKTVHLKNTFNDLSRILKSIRDPFLFVDSNFIIRYMNESTNKFLETIQSEGKSIWEFTPRLLDTKTEQLLRSAMREQKECHFRIQGMKTGIHYEVSVYPSPEGLCLFGVNIEEMLKIQEKLSQSLQEKELLLKESHHRIKNNLQVVASLIHLGSLNIKDVESLRIFEETSQRITTMATLHQILYESGNYSSIDIRRFSGEIINLIQKLYTSDDTDIKVNYSCGDIQLNANLAVSLGMILNELLTNCFKYAFRDRPRGEIDLSIVKEDKFISLTVLDDGNGLPPKLLGKQHTTLGLQLVDSLVQQFEGTIQISSPPGTRYYIRFPEKQHLSLP